MRSLRQPVPDEQRVRSLLGYAMRSDHPWSRLRRPELYPVNHERPAVSRPSRARDEQEFEGVTESRG